jgi:raffinose/stachyose/melibiose transport system permease protein
MTAITAAAPTGTVPRADRPGPARRFARRLPMILLLTVLLIIVVYPLIWLFLSSFKTQSEFLNEPFYTLPGSLNLDNYVSAFTTGQMGTYILNSIIAVFPSLIIMLVLGVAAAFALEVMIFKGRGGILLVFLAGIMVPAQMILLPLFTVFFKTGLTGTLWPLIITYVAHGLPLTVFMMATYFRAVPREMFEAATIDGANIYQMFWRVGIPMVRNAILTVGLVQFFFLWNDLLIAVTFINTQELQTIQVGLLNFTGPYGSIQYGPIFAAVCVSVLGTLLIYLFLNQRIMRGLAAGSVKG